MIKIRLADYNDIGPVVAMCGDAISSGAWGKVPFNLPHSIRMATTMIENGLVIVAEKEGAGVIGVLGLRVQDWAWAPGAAFIEALITYVKPHFRNEQVELHDGRKAFVAEGLIEFAKTICRGNKIVGLFPMMFGDQVQSRDRFAQSCGLAYVGGNFLFLPEQTAVKEAAE